MYDKTKQKNSKHAESRSCVHYLRQSWDGLIDQSAQTCGYLTNYNVLQTVTPRSCRSCITNRIAVVCFCPILISFTIKFDENNLGITCKLLEDTGGQIFRRCEERKLEIKICFICFPFQKNCYDYLVALCLNWCISGYSNEKLGVNPIFRTQNLENIFAECGRLEN